MEEKIIFFMDGNEVSDYSSRSSRTEVLEALLYMGKKENQYFDVGFRKEDLQTVHLSLHDSHALMRKIYVAYYSMLLV